jgi:hypothetical protein
MEPTVAQAGLQLLGSREPHSLNHLSAGTAGIYCHAWLHHPFLFHLVNMLRYSDLVKMRIFQISAWVSLRREAFPNHLPFPHLSYIPYPLLFGVLSALATSYPSFFRIPFTIAF